MIYILVSWVFVLLGMHMVGDGIEFLGRPKVKGG